MKYLYIILLILVASCSGPKLYQQGLVKIEKAIKKDPSLAFPTDTIKVTERDTIQGADGKDSIIQVTNTIQLPCDFDVEAFMESVEKKSWRELNNERKKARDSTKHLERMYKLETNRLQDSLNFQKKLIKELTDRLDDESDANVKLAKEKTKQTKGGWLTRLAGRYWWVIAIVFLIVGFYLRGLIPSIFNIFKSKS